VDAGAVATRGYVSQLGAAPFLVDLVPDPTFVYVSDIIVLYVVLASDAVVDEIVSLSTDAPTLVGIPSTVTVLAGDNVASFSLSGLTQGMAEITASLGTEIATLDVEIHPRRPTEQVDDLEVEVVQVNEFEVG
jgi:hypothetical protein